MSGVLAAASVFSPVEGAVFKAIKARGLTSGLKLVLDAGDAASYPGTGTVWHDISGGDYDFNFAASANDPAFSGSAGANSAGEYMVYDGNDWHTYDTTAETWMSNLHKDNAVWSMIAGVYLPAATNVIYPWDSSDSLNHHGVQIGCSGTGGVNFFVDVRHGSGSALTLISTTELNDSAAWNFVGFSMDEASSTSGVMQVNGTSETGKTVTYSSPSSSAATAPRLGATQSVGIQSANTRMAFLAFWEGTAIGATALTNLYNDIKADRAYGF